VDQPSSDRCWGRDSSHGIETSQVGSAREQRGDGQLVAALAEQRQHVPDGACEKAWSLQHDRPRVFCAQVLSNEGGSLHDRFGFTPRKSRIEHIWSGLPQIAAVNADIA
jgi:hypothetical protein